MTSRSTVRPTDARPVRKWIGAALAAAVMATAAPVAYAQDEGEGGPSISLIRDTEIEEILHQDADPVFIAAGLDPKTVQIHLLGDPDMNAFVAGGQQLFVNYGLIIRTKTPNQLIGVMAHETGHMAGGHLARSEQGEKQTLATYLLTIGLGIAAAAAGAPDAGAGLIYSAGYFAALTGAGFTRIQEASADQAAVTYLEKSGQSAKGLVDFFDNFRYEEVFSDARRFKFFMDHPLTEDRIDALQTRASQQPHYNVTDTVEALEQHQIMIAKLKAFENLPAQTLYDYPETDTSFPARYARAIAYYKDLQTDKAIALTDVLIAERPSDPYLYELKGQILFEAGRPKDAEAPHRRSVELKPDAPLLRMNLGQTLLAEEDPTKVDEAITDLRHAVGVEPDNAMAWLLLSQAYDRKGDAGMARLAAAEQNFALGQTADARMFAMRARQQLPKNSAEWRRATDIVLVSDPSKDDLKMLSQEGSTGPMQR